VGNEIGGSHLTNFLSSKIYHLHLKWLVTWNCFSSLAVGPNTPTSTCIYFFRTTGQRKEKQSNNEKMVETIQGYQTDCSKSNVNAMKCMEKINKACCVVGVPAGIFLPRVSQTSHGFTDHICCYGLLPVLCTD
jgi:hypothetical protein